MGVKMNTYLNLFCLIVSANAKFQYNINDIDDFQPTFYKRDAKMFRSLDELVADPENAIEVCMHAINKESCMETVLNPYSWAQP